MRGFGVTALGLCLLYLRLLYHDIKNNAIIFFGSCLGRRWRQMSSLLRRFLFAVAAGIVAGVISNAIYALLEG